MSNDETAPADAGVDIPSEATDTGSRLQELMREGDIAADYLEGLLDIADLGGDLLMDVEGDRAMVAVVGADLGELVGPEGRVLDALQELSRLAVTRETGERSRMMLDVDGFRAALKAQLVEIGKQAVAEVQRTGEPVKLAPMTAFERKVVHDVVTASGLVSSSEGVDPDRRIVVSPA